MERYLIVIVFTLVLYFRSLRHGLVVDDLNQVVKMGSLRKNNKIKFIKNCFYGCGLFKKTLHDHTFRVILNCVLGCLVANLLDSTLAGLIYIAHPINNQITLWLNGRRYQTSLILGLMAVTFPMLGLILFPLALYHQPISAPLILLCPIGLLVLWGLPLILIIPKYKLWIKSRFKIQNFDIYKNFHPRKIIMAIKNLADYWSHFLFPRGFTMYHPKTWGIAELEGNKHECFALNARFWRSVAFLTLIHVLAYLIDISCLKLAIMADLGVFLWLGFWKNPVQLWAQRYAGLFSVFATGVLTAVLPEQYLMVFLALCVAVTLKDMGMYQNLYSFAWYHIIHQPNNYHANMFCSTGVFERYAMQYQKDRKITESKMASLFAISGAFYWVLNNQKPDAIHQFLANKLDFNKKAPN